MTFSKSIIWRSRWGFGAWGRGRSRADCTETIIETNRSRCDFFVLLEYVVGLAPSKRKGKRNAELLYIWQQPEQRDVEAAHRFFGH